MGRVFSNYVRRYNSFDKAQWSHRVLRKTSGSMGGFPELCTDSELDGQPTDSVSFFVKSSTRPTCEHCGKVSHEKKVCWVLHGKPNDFNGRIGGGKQNGRGRGHGKKFAAVHHVTTPEVDASMEAKGSALSMLGSFETKNNLKELAQEIANLLKEEKSTLTPNMLVVQAQEQAVPEPELRRSSCEEKMPRKLKDYVCNILKQQPFPATPNGLSPPVWNFHIEEVLVLKEVGKLGLGQEDLKMEIAALKAAFHP
ncbi:hypothetical protein M9H77_33919 [Catharanthus roseus]|uniref:Uncharacterized protein n=1 Tax=Catharanthus roseus TaxID=4058 RepID=A0ACB9ZJT3_CATRO|nr:hypothetical protein M9H77_33919 [Catharanthus roseus]